VGAVRGRRRPVAGVRCRHRPVRRRGRGDRLRERASDSARVCPARSSATPRRGAPSSPRERPRFSWVRGLGGAMGEGDAVALTASRAWSSPARSRAREGVTAASSPVTLVADTPGQPGAFLAELGRGDGAPVWARRLAVGCDRGACTP
jgi:hypothetical protein